MKSHRTFTTNKFVLNFGGKKFVHTFFSNLADNKFNNNNNDSQTSTVPLDTDPAAAGWQQANRKAEEQKDGQK